MRDQSARDATSKTGQGSLHGLIGRYRLVSKKPVEFEGKKFDWDLPIEIAGGSEVAVELSNDNAQLQEVAHRLGGVRMVFDDQDAKASRGLGRACRDVDQRDVLGRRER